MARKGDTYLQKPTLWHVGWGYPCRVMRKRKGQKRWVNKEYDVLTMESALRWAKLANAGKAIVRRDVQQATMYQLGISRAPERAQWAAPLSERQSRIVLARPDAPGRE